MTLDDYLHMHFVSRQRFAEMAGISEQRLATLIELGAVPRATYVCDGDAIESAVFGRIEAQQAAAGEYFRPECLRWVAIAERAAAGGERDAVLAVLSAELHAALAGTGEDPAAIDARIRQNYIPAFLDGTFGLCVADPTSGAGIARKECLQERLTEVTANGSEAQPAGIAREELLRLIDDYAAAAMPFSPAEFARCSRKRLVDDLRPRVAAR